MKKTNIITFSILLCFMMLFLIIGYAKLSYNLEVRGIFEVEAKPYVGVYISNVEVVSSNGAENISFQYLRPTNLATTVYSNTSTQEITYKVTVYNNSNGTYWYIGQKMVEDYESNSLINTNNGITITTRDKIEDVNATFDSNDWVPPLTYRDFYVTYTYGRNANGYLTTLINLDFDIKIESIYDEFLSVLNDKEAEYGYNYLTDLFNKRYAEDGTTVIGNVGEDAEIFENMFGSNLTLNVDGVEKPITILIRRENIDKSTTGDSYLGNGPSGCEYTLYITTDDLSILGENINVFAISYTKGINNEHWHRLGQLYEGSSSVTDYDSSTYELEGAIDVYEWKAIASSYEISDGIIYNVGQTQGDQYDKINTLEDLMTVFDQDIFNDIDNKRIFKTVYDILQENVTSVAPEVMGLRSAFEAASPYYVNYNNGQEFKVVRDVTRAELIPYIIDINNALDYYYQVHSNN